ncbi:MAG: molybdopterin molybdenumtransferase MoeA [Salinibacterium sp.]|nr:MAG: molybdopterin molybdenumtransferase MoeA [Salinibacterium sp.]
MIEWDEARNRAYELGRAVPTPTEQVALADAVGRTLAVDVHSLVPLPGYASSAMDGWVVAGNGPWTVGEPILAGDAPANATLETGHARPIATGGPTPPGAWGVLRSEHGLVRADGALERNDNARRDEPREGEHIRRTGEEAAAGDPLTLRGSILTPPRIALAAASGHDSLEVAERVRVDIALLGTEIISSGMPEPGQVRDAYAPQLPALLHGMGAQPGTMRRVADDLDSTSAALASSDAPLLITTGGTAGGPADHVRAALQLIGAELLIDGVNMRPGHPVLLARRNDGGLILCLPGNPLAAMACLASFAAPLVQGLLSQPLSALGSTSFAADVTNPAASTRLLLFSYGPEGAVPTDHQRSGMLRGLADAVGFAIVPPGGASKQEWVRLLPLPWQTD